MLTISEMVAVDDGDSTGAKSDAGDANRKVEAEHGRCTARGTPMVSSASGKLVN